MPLVGDFAKLARFRQQIGQLEEMPRLVALGSVAGIEKLLTAEFSAAETPYGSAWEPLKDGGAPLQPLVDDVEVTAFGAGKIREEALFPGNLHNSGTKNTGRKRASKKITAAVKRGFIEKPSTARRRELAEQISNASGVHNPMRMIVPLEGQGVPAAQQEVLAATAEKIFAGTMREAA